jgi:hypothetical protein
MTQAPAAIDPRQHPHADDVVTTAFYRAAAQLGLNQRQQAAVLGVSPATVSRHGQIRTSTKVGEMALLFLRVYRSLSTLYGLNIEQCRGWITAENHHLAGRPIDLVQRAEGLVRVADYLDAMRG